MDGEHFDALSRSLVTVGSRRRLVRLFGALPLVGTLAAVFAGDTVATDHPGKRRGQHGKTPAATPRCDTDRGGLGRRFRLLG